MPRKDHPILSAHDLHKSYGPRPALRGLSFSLEAGRILGFLGPNGAGESAQGLLEEVGLQQRAKSLISTFSHGMRQRIGIARALINSPAIVFFDEPTLGLDPRGQQELLALIKPGGRERNKEES